MEHRRQQRLLAELPIRHWPRALAEPFVEMVRAEVVVGGPELPGAGVGA